MQSFGSHTAVVLLSVSILMGSGCGRAKDQKSQTGARWEEAANIVPVEVAAAQRENLSVTKTYSGTLEGEEQANIVPKISERITGINAHVGEPVRAGQVTVSLDKSGASSQFYQAKANFKNAERTLQRMKSLYDEGAISLQSLDGAQTAYDVAKANFEAARSTVELGTPIAGVVTAVNANLGDLASPGSVLMTIAKIDRMKVAFNINETDVASLSIGQKVQVYSEAKPDAKVEGRVFQLSKSADVRSRTFEIKAVFPNSSDRWFKPGMFCKVNLQLSPREKALVIPGAAIQSDGVTNRVYVIRNGRASQRIVQLGVTDDERVEILQGLAERDTVATVGVNNLKDSSLVSVVSRPK